MAPQINIVLSATNRTGSAFQSVGIGLTQMASTASQTSAAFSMASAMVSNATTRTAQAQQRSTLTTQQSARADAQLAALKQRVAAASTDAAGRVRLYEQAMSQAAAGSRDYYQAQLRLISAQREVARASGGGGAPVLPRSFAGFTGQGLLQGAGALGIATSVSEITQQVVSLTQESGALAVQAETIGRAYQGATERAGVGAGQLLATLRQVSRGTVADTNLMLSANKALSLGVGRNVDEIGQLLAIARQRGKDFGISTEEAFQRIVEGLGKAEPEILDELGILIDSNKVYADYAKNIGISVDQLTKKQKILAVTNDVLRTNSDLVVKNAQAQLDAADVFAQAQARTQAAQTRYGRAALPALSNLATTGAGAADFATGGLSPGEFLTGMAPKGGAAEFVQSLARLTNPVTTLAETFRILNGAETEAIKRAEEKNRLDASDLHDRHAAQAADRSTPTITMNPSPPARFAGFGSRVEPIIRSPYAPPASASTSAPVMGSRTGPTTVINVYPRGLVHSSRDLADAIREAQREDARHNAGTGSVYDGGA